MKKTLFTALAALTFAVTAAAAPLFPPAIPTVKADVLKVNNRPAEKDRLFRSDAVEKQIKEIVKQLTNVRLAWMFVNCYPNTIDTTVHFKESDKHDNPDTFIYTGDIHAISIANNLIDKKCFNT